jgi:hypothetical protein
VYIGSSWLRIVTGSQIFKYDDEPSGSGAKDVVSVLNSGIGHPFLQSVAFCFYSVYMPHSIT